LLKLLPESIAVIGLPTRPASNAFRHTEEAQENKPERIDTGGICAYPADSRISAPLFPFCAARILFGFMMKPLD
jgi:hypothetical protein